MILGQVRKGVNINHFREVQLSIIIMITIITIKIINSSSVTKLV